MNSVQTIKKLAFIGNYVPRRCGIATFTADLFGSVSAQHREVQSFALAVSDHPGHYSYPSEVRFELDEKDLSSYQRAAEFINLSEVDVVCLQHEYGIFGGNAGSHILALLRELKAPVVTTLHTVLKDPGHEQRRVMNEIIRLSSRLVVMTEMGSNLLREVHQVPDEKVDLIPHGIPDLPFVDSNFYKDVFCVEGRHVLLTFGLLSPNKGIEYVLDALPQIVREYPQTVYIVLGATHPKLIQEQGEAYRIHLERLAIKNGVQKHVIFYNRYVEPEQLHEFIGAADIYITPYLNESQITSGTLSYSFGSGKAVISTPYWHARELLSQGRGVLVPFADHESIARHTIELLRDEVKRHSMRKSAYMLGRSMTWERVGQHYYKVFEQARLGRGAMVRKVFSAHTLDQQDSNLPHIKLDHLASMTDSTGVFQHAKYNIPDFEHGYCTDDNARALLFAVLLEDMGYSSPEVRRIAVTSLAFLNHAFNPGNGRFRNFMSFSRQWLEEAGSEDSHGRALWALGTAIGRSGFRGVQKLAGQLMEKGLPAVASLKSPRAWAFSLLGIHECFRRLSGDRRVDALRTELTERLLGVYRKCARKSWPWFEEVATYSNAKLPHALILSGRWTGNGEALEVGLTSLRWLVEVQTSPEGYFRAIGCNGFYPREGQCARYDQQPLEAYSMVSACIEAFRVTGDQFWMERAGMAFDWFLGRNDLGVQVYDPESGGCRDALHVDRLNENQGAESTLAYLLSLAEMHQIKSMLVSFRQAQGANQKIA